MLSVLTMKKSILLIEIVLLVFPAVGFWIFSIFVWIGTALIFFSFDLRFTLLIVGGGFGLSGFSTLARVVISRSRDRLSRLVSAKILIGVATAAYHISTMIIDGPFENFHFSTILVECSALICALHFVQMAYVFDPESDHQFN